MKKQNLTTETLRARRKLFTKSISTTSVPPWCALEKPGGLPR